MASPKTKKTATSKKTVKSKKSAPLKPEATEPKLEAAPESDVPRIEDPIGDETDGEAETANMAVTESESETEVKSTATPEFTPASRPPAKLERLQKILAAAGVASRRRAEAMIEQGRVEVNGKVVTVLGTKADAARDHIRVDGKLLHGPERHRYFVLNKPRGYVTTVKDPEGRPTVMQFFSKMKERLYPVGRLDYMSEGLLVVTNDGELANRLTKASSGVEKTYLVKVSGQPTEAELNVLRGGVAIERGKPGSPQVRTSPARIRQVRQGDNPWYEVTLIEGRNRELRKMFEEIGHFVEKIRRVGYGPLVLDQEPGNLRELQPEELAALCRTAEDSVRTPKSKELRRRNLFDAGLLPTVLPKPSSRPHTTKPPDRFTPAAGRPGNYRPQKFISDRPSGFRPKNFGKDRPSRPADSFASGSANKLFRPVSRRIDRPAPRPDARPGARPTAGHSFDRPSTRPAWKKDDRPSRPPVRFSAGSTGENRPGAGRSSDYKTKKFSSGRPFSANPAWKRPEHPAPNRSTSDRSGPALSRLAYQRPSAPRREGVSEFRSTKTKPYPNSASRPERKAGPGWKPKPNYSPGKPEGGSRSRPKSGSFSKSGAAKRTGPRPFGNRPGGKPGAPTDRSSSAGWKRTGGFSGGKKRG